MNLRGFDNYFVCELGEVFPMFNCLTLDGKQRDYMYLTVLMDI